MASMKKEDFYRKYANMPLAKRFIKITPDATRPNDSFCANEIYLQLKTQETKIEMAKEEIDRLDKYYSKCDLSHIYKKNRTELVKIIQ